uniref:Uncharacterized protein n=1 Tax=Aegilops tauschii subsp. strangulata TaxID=200361 RepID=A0A453A1E2_AEGTS
MCTLLPTTSSGGSLSHSWLLFPSPTFLRSSSTSRLSAASSITRCASTSSLHHRLLASSLSRACRIRCGRSTTLSGTFSCCPSCASTSRSMASGCLAASGASQRWPTHPTTSLSLATSLVRCSVLGWVSESCQSFSSASGWPTMPCSSSLCISGSPPMCNSQRSSIQCSFFSSPRLASRPWPGRGSLASSTMVRSSFTSSHYSSSVASMAWTRISGEFNDGAKLLYFISLFLYVSLVVRVNLFRGFRFSLAWWAYTFPMTSVALATVLYASEVDNVLTRSLAVGLSGIAVVTVTGVLATTMYHAFLRKDLFPNDVSIAITRRRPKFSKILAHLRSSSSDVKELVLSIPNFSSNSKQGAYCDDAGSIYKTRGSVGESTVAQGHGRA